MVPDLRALPMRPRCELRPGRDVSDGIYCLDCHEAMQPCESTVLLKRGALDADSEEFEVARSFMRDRVADSKPVLGHPVPRKECTFGPTQYKSYQRISDPLCWPPLVARVLEATVALARQLGVPRPEEYNSVHANYYQGASSSIARHSDDEAVLLPAPIFSYTFLEGDGASMARDFTIWKKARGAEHIEGKGKVAKVTLFSGDLLVMRGRMQEFFEHGVEKVPSAAPRLNFTVRKFVDRKKLNPRSGDADLRQ